MWFGAALVFVQATLAGAYSPFSDGMETLMEFFSGMTNVINCLVGLSIKFGLGSDLIHDIILFTFNLINLGVIMFTLVISPIRTYLFLQK